MHLVIGAGLTGLTAAKELVDNGEEVLVVEREKEVGGFMGCVTRNGYSVEKYYHHFFTDSPNFTKLIDDLGLSKKLEWKKATNGAYYDKLYPLDTPLDMLKFKPLSLMEKAALARTMLAIKMIKDSKEYDNVSTKDWILKNSSEGAFEKFLKPLVLSKYGDADDISATWFIERMKLRNKRGVSGEKLCYMRGGFQQALDKMTEEILDKGGEIKTSSHVSRLTKKGGKIESATVNKREMDVESVISTVPPESLAKAFPFFKKPNVKYQGALCVLVALKKQVHPYYWTNIIKPSLSFGAVVEHTNFMPLNDYGEHLVYLASYPKASSALWIKSDAEVFSEYFRDLGRIFPVKKEDVLKYWVFRSKESGIIFSKGTTNHIMPTTTDFDNLFVGGMFNSYPERSAEESARLGYECAKRSMGV